MNSLDFDSTGELLALGYPDQIVVESLTAGTEQTSCPGATESIAFIDPDHLMLISKDQARICEWRTGKIVATSKLNPTAPNPTPQLLERKVGRKPPTCRADGSSHRPAPRLPVSGIAEGLTVILSHDRSGAKLASWRHGRGAMFAPYVRH